ncbi:MAG: hypothetical protein ACYCQI_14530 [Gammaproteobacteria bacterium]
MKQKVLLALGLLIAACNTYALPLEGGKVIKHTETISPNTQLTFKQGINNKYDLLKSKLNLKSRDSSHSFIQVIQQIGEIKKDIVGRTIIEANPSNYMLLYNESEKAKVYKITHEICIALMGQPTTTCSGASDIINVEPNQMFHDHMIPVFETILDSGDYFAVLATTIESDDKTGVTEVYDFKDFTIAN